jgi:Ni,Fe-hydrogenase III large subunit/Ni,Fe-hydrogenase III component G
MTMENRQKIRKAIEEGLSQRFTVLDGTAPNELYLILKDKYLSELPEICSILSKTFKAFFVTLIPNDERTINGNFCIYYVFSVPHDDVFLILCVSVDPRQREISSISTVIDAATWFEREMKDWFGIVAFPNIPKLAAHPDWPEDVYPMLKEFDARTQVTREKGTFDFRQVEGEGVFEIPVGPVHAGIIEPGHFRFTVAGEPIINLDVQLFYAHKGTEKIAEGMTPHRAIFLAERISGDSSFAHALAFCHAIERLANVEVPKRATIIRTLLLELERLHNHLGDIGAMLLDVGFSVGAQTGFRLKEQMLQLNEVLTGSRLLRGMVAIGGVRRLVGDTVNKRETLRRSLHEVCNEFERLVDLVMSTASVLDRFETTGKLKHEDAHRLGIVGIAARASGVNRDLRRDHPHCAYPHLTFKVPLYTQGDVLARFNIRVDEVRESFKLIDQLQRQHVIEEIVNTIDSFPAFRHALGYVEGWRGEIVHWVMTDKDDTIYRWKITDPSFHNWRALKLAVLHNIVPDFPVINKSFNLSYSGNDR